MQQKLLQIAKYLLFLSFGIFLVWWSIHRLDDKNWENCKQAFREARYILIAPVFLILLLSHYSRAVRWKILMHPMGYKPSTLNTFFAVMIGYMANLAIPRLGEVLKCTILAKYEKVPADKLVGTILIERAIDVFSLMLVFVIALATQAHVIGTYASETLQKYFLAGGTTAVLKKLGMLIAIVIVFILFWKLVINRYAHLHLVDKLKKMLLGVRDGLTSIRRLEHKWAFIFHSFIIWAGYLTGTYLGFFAIQETAGLPFAAAFPVLAFASIGMIVTPGGIGLYPILVSEVLILYNIPEGYGFANGNLQWVAQALIILVVGFICLLLLPGYNRRRSAAAKQ